MEEDILRGNQIILQIDKLFQGRSKSVISKNKISANCVYLYFNTSKFEDIVIYNKLK